MVGAKAGCIPFPVDGGDCRGMTTIAYRDGMLAADTVVTENGYRVGSVQKIGQIGEVLFGVCGVMAHMVEFRDWIRRGLVGTPPSVMAVADDGGSTAMIVYRDHILCWDRDRWDMMRAPFYAMGTGAKAALGAMAAGATAEEAVAAAILCDTASGGPITILRR